MANNRKSTLDSNDDRRSPPKNDAPPLQEPLGGYIFVCNNETMGEDLKRNLFGLPQRYHDSVRGIQPGMPLFLYNYSLHQLHGIFEASSGGGLNLDPIAWENKDGKNGRPASRFPSQVRVRLREDRPPLSEKAFRPVLDHYDGPKFRLELTQDQVKKLLTLFGSEDSNQASHKPDAEAQKEEDGGEWEKVKVRNKGIRNHTSINHRAAAGKRSSSPTKWRSGGGTGNGLIGTGHSSPGHGTGAGHNYDAFHGKSGKDNDERHKADRTDAPRWRPDPDSWAPSSGNATASGRGDDYHTAGEHEGSSGGKRSSRSSREGGSLAGGGASRRHHQSRLANGIAPGSQAGGRRDTSLGQIAVGGQDAAASQDSAVPSASGGCISRAMEGATVIEGSAPQSSGGEGAHPGGDAKASENSMPVKPSSSTIDSRARAFSFAAILRGNAEGGQEGDEGTRPGEGAENGASSCRESNDQAKSSSTASIAPSLAKGPRTGVHGSKAGKDTQYRQPQPLSDQQGPSSGLKAGSMAGKGGQPGHGGALSHGRSTLKGSKGMENGIANLTPGGTLGMGERQPVWGKRATRFVQNRDASGQEPRQSGGPWGQSSAANPASSDVASRSHQVQAAAGSIGEPGKASGGAVADSEVRPSIGTPAEVAQVRAAEPAPLPSIKKPAWQGNDAAILRRLAEPDAQPAVASKPHTPRVINPDAQRVQPVLHKRLQLEPAVTALSLAQGLALQSQPQQASQPLLSPVEGKVASSAERQEQASVGQVSPLEQAQLPAGSSQSAGPLPEQQLVVVQRGSEGDGHRVQGALMKDSGRPHTLIYPQAMPHPSRVQARSLSSKHHGERPPQRRLTPPPRQDMQTPPPILQPPPQLHPLPPSAISAPPFRVSTPPLGLTSPTLHHQQYTSMFSHSHSQPQSPHGRTPRIGRPGGNFADPGSPIYRPVERGFQEAGVSVPSTQQQAGGLFAPLVNLQQIVSPIVGHPQFLLPAPALLSNASTIHKEVMEYSELVRPSKEARARAEAAVDCVRGVVQSLWPGSGVEVFGSFATGLALPNSDVDVAVVNAPPPPDTPETQALTGARISAPLIRDLAAVLHKQEWCESMYTIETARIPVIKLKCQPKLPASFTREQKLPAQGDSSLATVHDSATAGKEPGAMKKVEELPGAPRGATAPLAPVAMDITIAGCRPSALDGSEGLSREWIAKLEDANMAHNGEAAREFVKEKLQALPALAPLVLLLKAWLQHRGLNDVYTGGLGSFSLTLMLVFYLERAPVSAGTPIMQAESLDKGQRWETSFPPSENPFSPNSSRSISALESKQEDMGHLSLDTVAESAGELNLTDKQSSASDLGCEISKADNSYRPGSEEEGSFAVLGKKAAGISENDVGVETETLEATTQAQAEAAMEPPTREIATSSISETAPETIGMDIGTWAAAGGDPVSKKSPALSKPPPSNAEEPVLKSPIKRSWADEVEEAEERNISEALDDESGVNAGTAGGADESCRQLSLSGEAGSPPHSADQPSAQAQQTDEQSCQPAMGIEDRADDSSKDGTISESAALEMDAAIHILQQPNGVSLTEERFERPVGEVEGHGQDAVEAAERRCEESTGELAVPVEEKSGQFPADGTESGPEPANDELGTGRGGCEGVEEGVAERSHETDARSAPEEAAAGPINVDQTRVDAVMQEAEGSGPGSTDGSCEESCQNGHLAVKEAGSVSETPSYLDHEEGLSHRLESRVGDDTGEGGGATRADEPVPAQSVAERETPGHTAPGADDGFRCPGEAVAIPGPALANSVAQDPVFLSHGVSSLYVHEYRRRQRGKSIVEELPASIRLVSPPSFGILLVGFLQVFGQEIDFAKVRLVLKSKNGMPDGVFWHDPNQRPTALWIDDPLRPGANIGAGSFAIWHVQAAFRDLLIALTRPQPPHFASPDSTDDHPGQRRLLHLLDQAFNSVMAPLQSPGRASSF